MPSHSIPKIQNAILQPDKNSTNVILVRDHKVPTPIPGSSEHLIRVYTTAITRGELLWLKDYPTDPELIKNKELVPCYDVAGVVVSAPESSSFKPGTEVYARSDFYQSGTAREYAILKTEDMAIRPSKFSWAESATVPMSIETAYQALFIHAGLKFEEGFGAKGKRVFITASSGAAGMWIVQLAKWAGAEVIGTCGENNLEYVKSIGASEVLDYTKTDIKAWATEEDNKADVVIDCIGGKSLRDAWWVVKEGGVLLSIFQPPEDMKPAGCETKLSKAQFFIMDTNGKELAQVTELINGEGNFRACLDSVWPFEDFQEAFSKLKSGKTRGKIVLDMGLA
jgi:NADPH:quinone reductase-like Zn-dependent oxidoreductase